MSFLSFLYRLAGVVALLCLLETWSARAADRPDWTMSAPHETAEYKFYLGRASRAGSETEGFNEATRDALERAILENFGFRTRVQRESLEEMDRVSATKRVQEISRDIEVQGFEQVESYREKVQEGAYDVWVLYRFSRAAIAHEQARLAHGKPDARTDFSETGDSSAARGGVLEIVSDPPGAHVSIDGEAAGVLTTPLRISNQLAPGKHSVTIDHPSFEPVDEEVILLPGRTVRVHKLLKRATGWVRVITKPSFANVSIDGKLVGLSPLEYKVPAGKNVRIEIAHRKAGHLIQEVRVERDEMRSLSFDLRGKSAFAETESAPGPLLASAGNNPVVGLLHSDDDWDKTPDRRPLTKESPDWLLRVPFQWSQSTLPGLDAPVFFYGVALEFRLGSRLGVILGYQRGSQPTRFGDEVSVQVFRAGLQGNLFQSILSNSDFLSLRAEWGYVLNSSLSTTPVPHTQYETGLNLGYGWQVVLPSNAFAVISVNGGIQRFYTSLNNLHGPTPLSMGADLAIGF